MALKDYLEQLIGERVAIYRQESGGFYVLYTTSEMYPKLVKVDEDSFQTSDGRIHAISAILGITPKK